MLSSILARRSHDPSKVSILTATGHINVEEVKKGKLEWIAKHIGDVDVIFVDKVYNKGSILVGKTGHHHLIDDRVSAIDSWVKMNSPNLFATSTLFCN